MNGKDDAVNAYHLSAGRRVGLAMFTVFAAIVIAMLGGCEGMPFMDGDDASADAPPPTETVESVDTNDAPSPRAESSPSEPTDAAPAPVVIEGPRRRYHYYPHHEVFYDVTARRYTWYELNQWKANEVLPAKFKLDPQHAVIIELPGEHPELSITRAHRYAREKGLVPGQARGVGGAAPDDTTNAQAPRNAPATQPVPATRPETDQPEPGETSEPERPKSLF